MAISPLIFFILIFGLFLVIDSFDPKLGTLSILIFLMFQLANLRDTESLTFLSTFYLIMGLIVLILQFSAYSPTYQGVNLSESIGVNLSFFRLPVFGILLGVALYYFIRLASASAEASILGAPTLSILPPDIFMTASIGMLGVIENRFFLTIFNILKGIIGIVFGALLVMVLFAMFHLFAYSLSISALIWAGIIMGLWIASYVVSQDDIVSNVSHSLHNVTVTISRFVVI